MDLSCHTPTHPICSVPSFLCPVLPVLALPVSRLRSEKRSSAPLPSLPCTPLWAPLSHLASLRGSALDLLRSEADLFVTSLQEGRAVCFFTIVFPVPRMVSAHGRLSTLSVEWMHPRVKTPLRMSLFTFPTYSCSPARDFTLEQNNGIVATEPLVSPCPF